MAPQTMFAFAVRMAPSFGVGVVVNSSLTERGHTVLRERYADAVAERSADRSAAHVEEHAGAKIRTHLHTMVTGQKLTS